MVHNIPRLFTTEMRTNKVVIDATRPLDKTIPEMNRVPKGAMDRINLDDYLKEA
jgi:2,5-furandicarboxylate decarboxylase 1